MRELEWGVTGKGSKGSSVLWSEVRQWPPGLYLETRPPVIWTGKNEYGRVEIWRTGCGRANK